MKTLTQEQRDLIIEALKNDASNLNEVASTLKGSAKTSLALEANRRVSLAAHLEGAGSFEYRSPSA